MTGKIRGLNTSISSYSSLEIIFHCTQQSSSLTPDGRSSTTLTHYPARFPTAVVICRLGNDLIGDDHLQFFSRLLQARRPGILPHTLLPRLGFYSFFQVNVTKGELFRRRELCATAESLGCQPTFGLSYYG